MHGVIAMLHKIPFGKLGSFRVQGSGFSDEALLSGGSSTSG